MKKQILIVGIIFSILLLSGCEQFLQQNTISNDERKLLGFWKVYEIPFDRNDTVLWFEENSIINFKENGNIEYLFSGLQYQGDWYIESDILHINIHPVENFPDGTSFVYIYRDSLIRKVEGGNTVFDLCTYPDNGRVATLILWK